jgi:hypothetical protein
MHYGGIKVWNLLVNGALYAAYIAIVILIP